MELTLSGYQELAEQATARLIQQHSPSGRRIGFIDGMVMTYVVDGETAA